VQNEEVHMEALQGTAVKIDRMQSDVRSSEKNTGRSESICGWESGPCWMWCIPRQYCIGEEHSTVIQEEHVRDAVGPSETADDMEMLGPIFSEIRQSLICNETPQSHSQFLPSAPDYDANRALEILAEMVEAESRYTLNLTALSTVLSDLKQQKIWEDPMTRDDRDIMLSALEEIRLGHTETAKLLREGQQWCTTEPSEVAQLRHMLHPLVPQAMAMVSALVSHSYPCYVNRIQGLQSWLKQHRLMASLRECLQTEGSGGITFQAMLVLPIQRSIAYKLLLERLTDTLQGAESPELRQMHSKGLISSLESIAGAILELESSNTEFEKLQDMQRKIIGGEEYAWCSEKRKLLYQGKMVGGLAGEEQGPYMLFLLSDSLLFCTPAACTQLDAPQHRSLSVSYTLVKELPLVRTNGSGTLKRCHAKGQDNTGWSISHGRHSKSHFVARSQTSRDKWISTVNEAATEQLRLLEKDAQ